MANGTAVKPEIPVSEQCSKCGNPREADGYPKWCNGCRATYKREYEILRKEMTETRGYAAGVSAMRAYLAERFLQLASGHFDGREVARLISQATGPNGKVKRQARPLSPA
jgi:hypothetical protein